MIWTGVAVGRKLSPTPHRAGREMAVNVPSLRIQMSVARGRIQSHRYWLRKCTPGSPGAQTHAMVIRREQSFLRDAKAQLASVGVK